VQRSITVRRGTKPQNTTRNNSHSMQAGKQYDYSVQNHKSHHMHTAQCNMKILKITSILIKHETKLHKTICSAVMILASE